MVSPMSFQSFRRGKMAPDTWWLHHGGSIPVTTWSLQSVSQMEHTDMLHATYRLKIAICYRSKRCLLPLRDRCYCPYELVILFRLAGSKHYLYLRIHPSEYVGFPYAGWWRERGNGKEENCPLQEIESFPRSSSCPCYIKDVLLQVVLTWLALKALSGHLHANKQGYPNFLLISKGPVFYTSAWRILRGMLTLNANPTIILIKRTINQSRLRWDLNS
jgi:hypothetical protein